MSKTLGALGSLIVAATVVAWMAHQPARATPPMEPQAGVTCGTHHCSPNSICCPNCSTGELRCAQGPRCPECAPR